MLSSGLSSAQKKEFYDQLHAMTYENSNPAEDVKLCYVTVCCAAADLIHPLHT